MINQLLGSSQRQSRLKKASIFRDAVRNQSTLRKSQQTTTNAQSGRKQFKQQYWPVRPYRVGWSSSILENNEDISGWNIRESIKNKLKQKKVLLPQIYSFVSETINDSRRIQNKTNYKQIQKHPQFKARIKTESDAIICQQQNQHFQRTMNQIEDINYSMMRGNRRNATKAQMRPTYVHVESTPRRQIIPRFIPIQIPTSRPKMFEHLNRRYDFDRYVNYLQKMNFRKINNRNYQIQTRYPSPSSLKTYESTRANNSPQPVSRNIEQEQSQADKTKQYESLKKKQNFIKLLKKAKNRGESLLVKLSKFPSNKSIHK